MCFAVKAQLLSLDLSCNRDFQYVLIVPNHFLFSTGSTVRDMAQGNTFLRHAQTNRGMFEITKSLMHYFLSHYGPGESRLSHTVGVQV